ncbi:hypothetical protein [Pelagicoccus mobilis]|uniref:ACT domain-containing protein n=1 Tax=Pelagicoccus mobilis TaxID=415221 RepID=A0A934S2S7_9BACT|nr:hypothetical protein [Pelagicoccus mobilis]MBK1879601.1 hypothetical protein [Pelagicoccus mobilis]
MKQIRIVTRSRMGLTAEIAEILGDKGINIESMDAEEVSGMDVVSLEVDRYNQALHALRDAGFPAVTEDALLLRVKDEPGALAMVANRFKEADVHLRSIRIIRHERNFGIVAVSSEDSEKARLIVKDCLLE